MKLKQNVTVRLESELYKKIKRIAFEREKSISNTIEEVLKKWVEEEIKNSEPRS